MFDKDVREKVSRVNFITILNDGTTDAAIIEQEVVYFLFADPDTFEPSLAFFSVIELTESQDAAGLKTALEEALKSKDMDIMDKTVFLASDGASVNSGLKSGLITLLKEERPWITFVWCLSHRLELAL